MYFYHYIIIITHKVVRDKLDEEKFLDEKLQEEIMEFHIEFSNSLDELKTSLSKMHKCASYGML